MDELGLGQVGRDPLVQAVDLILADAHLGDGSGQGLEYGPLRWPRAARLELAASVSEQFGEQPLRAVHVHRPSAFVELELGGRQVGLDCLLALPESGHGKAELTAAVVGGVQPLGQPLDLGVLGVELGLEGLGLGGQGGVGEGRGGVGSPGGGNRQGEDDGHDQQSDGDGLGTLPIYGRPVGGGEALELSSRTTLGLPDGQCRGRLMGLRPARPAHRQGVGPPRGLGGGPDRQLGAARCGHRARAEAGRRPRRQPGHREAHRPREPARGGDVHGPAGRAAAPHGPGGGGHGQAEVRPAGSRPA